MNNVIDLEKHRQRKPRNERTTYRIESTVYQMVFGGTPKGAA